MKKTIYLLAAALFFGNVLFAQTPTSTPSSGPGYANGADKNFHFGLSIVPGLTWLSPGSTTTSSNTTFTNKGNGISLGFGFGVNLEFYFTQNYGFCTGIGLVTLPGKYTTTAVTTNSGVTDSTVASQHQLKMQYLQIPLMFKFRTLPVGLFRYFAMVGLNPGVRLSSKDTFTTTGTTIVGDYTVSGSGVDANSETSIVRIPYVVGLGAEYNIAGTTSLQAMLSFDSDFINISTINGNSVTSKAVNLTIGVLF